MWAGTCCRALNSTVLGPAVCTNLYVMPDHPAWMLSSDYSSLQRQVVYTAQSDHAMKHSYFLTHLTSYLDCIASMFINCSSIAGQETLIWHEDVRFQCPCGTVFVIFVHCINTWVTLTTF